MAPDAEVIGFGPYRLDRRSGRLLHGEHNVPLRLKTFAVLEYLATHPGRLVGKDELLDAVWPDTCVTPSVLTGCIRELRRALGDDARAARFVETAHRRGYRFIASPIAEMSSSGPTVPRTAQSNHGELMTIARRLAEMIAGVIDSSSPSEHGAVDKAVDVPVQHHRRRSSRA